VNHLIKLEKNIKERCMILAKADNDPKVQQILKSICKKDIIYFFDNFVTTDRNPWLIPEKYWNIIPFMLFDFQKEYLIDAIDAIFMWQLPLEERTKPTNIFSEKSRQMWFSWLYAWLQLYCYMFHDMKSLYISMKQDEVDKSWDIKSHFEKIRFMIRNLPSWMLPEWLSKEMSTTHNKAMTISRWDWTWVIKWESANPNAWRWWTVSFTIFDEMAFMQYAQAINMSIASSTPCRFFNSTPNWEWNEYYRMRKLALEWEIRYHRCHWSENVFYTQEWYNWRIKGMTPQQIAQELEIEYCTAIIWRVYPEYRAWKYNNEYNESLPLQIWIDHSHGGFDVHAIVIVQIDKHYYNILDACEFNCSVTNMAKILSRQASMQLSDIQLKFYNKYLQYKPATFIWDPYDHNATLNESTINEVYQKEWIFLNIPQNRKKQEQIRVTQSNLHRLRVNEWIDCFDYAMSNCKYPEVKEWHSRTTPNSLPIHDNTSHIRTAVEYWMTYNKENEEHINGPEERIAYEKQNPLTGEISVQYY